MEDPYAMSTVLLSVLPVLRFMPQDREMFAPDVAGAQQMEGVFDREGII
jgi:hypothetical protein